MKRSPPLRERMFRPVDIAPLVFFRIVGGALITMEIAGELATDYRLPYTASDVHFSYLFAPWLAPWPPAGVYLHFSVNVLAGLCVTLGLFYRTAAVVLFVGQTSLFLMEKSVYINHTYLYCLVSFLLIFVPAHRAFSLDAWRNPRLAAATAPAWCLWILRFQMAVVYVFAGLAKLDSDWLRARPLAEVWLPARSHYPVVGPLLAAAWIPYALAWGGLALDLFVVPALLWARTRALAFVAATLFHLSNVVVFGLGTFPWFSITMTSMFLPPAAFRRLPVLRDHLPALMPTATRAAAPRAVGSRRTTVAALLALYAGVQLVVPLRHFFYRGEPNWTEAGHNFAWHMMLRVKHGTVVFHVLDPVSGRTWTEHPRERMPKRQYDRFVGQPDLILQFAHFLAADYAARGWPDVEVRAETLVSLNRRSPQRLVDPTVDLARERRRLGRYPWVIDLEDHDAS